MMQMLLEDGTAATAHTLKTSQRTDRDFSSLLSLILFRSHDDEQHVFDHGAILVSISTPTYI